jgi:hypothetical protein
VVQTNILPQFVRKEGKNNKLTKRAIFLLTHVILKNERLLKIERNTTEKKHG